MAKNLIPIIAKELGVEIGEEFAIKRQQLLKYRFNNDVLEFEIRDGVWERSGLLVTELNDIEVIKLPFKPKENEKYWTYFGDKFFVDYTVWANTPFDYGLESIGCVFRTKEEALAARPEKFKELTGKEWEE